jgi:tetratricopeptide (TPR) repeat protein
VTTRDGAVETGGRLRGMGKLGWSRKVLLALLVGALLAALEPPDVRASDSDKEDLAETTVRFADYLYAHEEYYRAIGEYKRYLFLAPEGPEAPFASLRIAECYAQGRRWSAALDALKEFLQGYGASPLQVRGRLLRARVLMELGRGEEARNELQHLLETKPGESVAAEAWYLIALSLERESRWLEADEALRQVSSQSRLFSSAQGMRQVLAEASSATRKSPALAGVLAAAIPGAGHLYCERPADGALAFGVTGAFAWATVEAFQQDHEALGVGLGFVTLAFYGGNIFSAVNVAHKYNDREDHRLRLRLSPYEQLSLEVDPGPAASVRLTFFF